MSRGMRPRAMDRLLAALWSVNVRRQVEADISVDRDGVEAAPPIHLPTLRADRADRPRGAARRCFTEPTIDECRAYPAASVARQHGEVAQIDHVSVQECGRHSGRPVAVDGDPVPETIVVEADGLVQPAPGLPVRVPVQPSARTGD